MENDLYDIKEILPIFEPYVKRLEVDELLPYVEMVVRVNICRFIRYEIDKGGQFSFNA